MANYIGWIRSKVGKEHIFTNFAGAIITNERGEILLQKRRDNGQWGFPGGAMELGESAEDTVKREVMEETGYAVEIRYLQGVYTRYDYTYPNGDSAQTMLTAFVCRITGGEPLTENEETRELRFFAPESAPPLFNRQNVDMLADFREGRKGVYR
ncbi:NUDIX hydrolase [Paenibacillus wulumuqiensis]|uniref:NUDIX hydrolase n=1 Tax=Paenibacillus wulumuqiensis TaxID=1567107 RepID=UPI0006193A12|nr:NUDIX hydrolase [Paenibacillus wulumuqiensis]